MRISGIALLFLLLCAGCATQKINPEIAVVVDTFQMGEPDRNKERITFVRDSGMIASGCTFFISVNGVRVGGLKPGQRIDVFVPAGEHVVAVGTDSFMCGKYETSASCLIEVGKPKAFRVGLPHADIFSHGSLAIMPIPI